MKDVSISVVGQGIGNEVDGEKRSNENNKVERQEDWIMEPVKK